MRITQLDGVRALLALWVVFGHLAIQVGWHVPFLTNPGVAVDLFMMLSGFFIATTFESLASKHDYRRAAGYFWIRRAMRIWPLYAILLTVAWAFLDHFSALKLAVAQAFPPPWAGDKNYSLQGFDVPSLTSIVMHYTLLFGVIDKLATSTPLPDWSLSLEFQFYLLYPLLFVLIRKNLIAVCFVAIAFAYVSPKLFGFYLTPGQFAHFRQPSFIAYKLNIFLVGALFHFFLRKNGSDGSWDKFLYIAAIILSLAVSGVQITLGAFAIFYLLIAPGSLASRVLNFRAFRFYGEISYTVYLVHLLILLPMVGLLIHAPWFTAQPPYRRFLASGLILVPLVTAVSWALNVLIEKPGIRLGHAWTSANAAGAHGKSTDGGRPAAIPVAGADAGYVKLDGH